MGIIIVETSNAKNAKAKSMIVIAIKAILITTFPFASERGYFGILIP
ncbi:hypothetical protein HMPREF0653_00502 [Prevotella disiens JCM 6334 = ATCC 29426]|uniref:Uncharacterized protein n=1 Tax=Prevotella disiens JCM 6334 = ATCC 29426 TaxID=1235811 RepID=A0ABN0NUG9_9BACT|nr:hypothetical protein HMPREF0653_00502 [Prevotella disiens JCM 6334 = ATCC 29426]